MIVAALARANETDVTAAGEAVRDAERPRIHTFIATSDIHMTLQAAHGPRRGAWPRPSTRSASRARWSRTSSSPARTPPARTAPSWPRSSRRAIEEGATTINIPDTVGYTMPTEFQGFLLDLYERCPQLRDATLSVHCHNDLGLAVANSLAGVQVGARQVEGCINGIGERAGNASVEEVAMILRTRADALGGLWCGRRHARDHAHEPPGEPHDRLPGAAQQGDRRAQRLRARGRHPPARHARATR